MSKQSEAKEKQGYLSKCPLKICNICAHFASDSEVKTMYGTTWTKEKNIRCTLGGFKVNKTGTCKEWTAKETTTTTP